jgi:hypothetical protein
MRADKLIIHNETELAEIGSGGQKLNFTSKYIHINDKFRFVIDNDNFIIQKKISETWTDRFKID